MKKLSLSFALSFAVYILLLCFSEAALFHLGDYTVAALALIAFLYQLLYIFLLRRRDNVSLGRSIARFFLYCFWSIGIIAAYLYVYSFFAGFTTGFLWNTTTYYGFEAWAEMNRWCMFVLFIPAVIYSVIYFALTKEIKNNAA